MAKKMVHVGGGVIGKKRLIKRSKKKCIHKVIDYLLSDCYLFAPLLISPSPINNSHVTPTRGVEIRGRTKDNRSLVKKFQDYLKSDCYMYASLVTPKSPRLREKGETGRVEYVKKVSREVVVMSDFVEATVNGTPKCSIYSNSPSLTLSGERDPNVRRRIVVD